MSVVTCPLCTSAQDKKSAILGILGRMLHYRCRYCGGQWSRESGRRSPAPRKPVPTSELFKACKPRTYPGDREIDRRLLGGA